MLGGRRGVRRGWELASVAKRGVLGKGCGGGAGTRSLRCGAGGGHEEGRGAEETKEGLGYVGRGVAAKSKEGWARKRVR